MKIKRIGMAVAVLGMVGVAHAASISWTSSVAATDGGYGQNLSSGLFLTNGVFVSAENVGGSAYTFDGIDFDTGSITLSGGISSIFHDNPANSETELSSTGTYGTSGPDTVSLTGLTIGVDYRIQALVFDGRGDTGISGRTVSFDGADQGQYASGVSGNTWGTGLLVSGYFTADATTQDFTIEVFNGGTSYGGQLNAITLYEASYVAPPPFESGEPIPTVSSYLVRNQDSLPSASLGNDGNPNTYCYTQSRTVDGYYEVDLGSAYAISNVRLTVPSGFEGKATHLTLRVFDSHHQSVFSQHLDSTPRLISEIIIGSPVEGRYVRVGLENKERTNPSHEWYFAVSELEVFGQELAQSGIRTFDIDTHQINSNETVTLSWSVDPVNVTNLTLYPDQLPLASYTATNGFGNITLSPSGSVEYTLVAQDARYTYTRSTSVLVDSAPIPPRITEFVANNRLSLKDEYYDDSPDWIEIRNPGISPINLAGYTLSDTPFNLAKWAFPATNLPPHATLLVHMSGRNVNIDPTGVLHADFKLDADGGSLFLTAPGESIPIQSITNNLPQDEDLAYGCTLDHTWTFMDPTPDGDNIGQTYIGWLTPLEFSHSRGFYETPFTLSINNRNAGATVLMANDGKEPYLPWAGSLSIDETVSIRATVSRPGYRSPRSQTHSYIFIDTVIASPVMRTAVTQDPVYAPRMRAALEALPSISINVPETPGFPEQAASVEILWPDGTADLQANCGIKRFGGSWTTYAKQNFRLCFREEYGLRKLHSPILNGFDRGFPVSTSFDELDLRSGSHDMVDRGFYMSNRFVDDTMLDMGSLNPHGRFVHLYMNGVYWGQYHLRERFVDHFFADSLGGTPEEYNAVRGNDNIGNNFIPGTPAAPNYATWEYVRNNRTSYTTVKPFLDIAHLTDFMLLWMYGLCESEYRACGPLAAGSGYKFYMGDADGFLRDQNSDNTAHSGPGDIFGGLRAEGHPDFKILVADRIYKHFFNDGALTPAQNQQRLIDRMNEINDSLIAECARWGDQVHSETSTVRTPANWNAAADNILYNVFPSQTSQLLTWLHNRGLYPSFDPPAFNHSGGYVDPGFEVTMSAPVGTIYYTLDGSDPRLPGGGINPQALVYDGQTAQQTLIPKGAEWKYLDDGSDQGTVWINAGYSDTSWDAGNGELGYGDSIAEATVVGYVDTDPGTGGVQKNTTTYFRKTVNLSNVSAITALTLGLQRDDGAVVYINGQEVRRDNMTTGPVTFQSWASTAIAVPAESTYYNLSVDPSVLLEGDNVVAVEIHQASATSSDISFDMELVAQTSGSNSSAILLNGTTPVKARVLNAGTWSALNETIFAIGPVVENLRITEVMYHPQNDTNGLPNAEYIELQNIGTNALNLNFVRLTKGVDFTFPSLVVQPGGYVLVVRDAVAFASAYPGFAGVIAGTWEAGDLLSDGGEKVRLKDALGSVIHDFKYKDGWYETTDGQGFSLTVKNALATDLTLWDQKAGWRPSAVSGGSPGTSDTGQLPALGSIVINEVLAHSHSTAPDWIELHNTTQTAIHIGGWFLSDDNSGGTNTMKYEIPPATIIPAGGYQVFYENATFGNDAAPGCHVPFGLSEGDDQVYLHSGLEGAITGYVEEESFGASASGVAFGRYYKASTESYNFVAMSVNTPGAANAYPKVGPIVISEIMYNPDSRTNDTYDHDEYEYVVLHNITASPVTLEKLDENDIPWKFTGGIDYTFPANTIIPADGSVVIAKNFAAYAERYGSSAGVLGPYGGKLNNGGEKLDLSMPGDEEPGQLRYYILVDRVNYSDGSHPIGEDPWPIPPDGTGNVLERTYAGLYGNDVANWLPDADADGIANDLDPDDDNDGIPDDWEIEKGLNPLSDESGDSDSDQFDNWYEYMTDTDPLDGSSFQTFWMEPFSGSTVTSRFSTSARRRYTIRYRDNLLTESWSDLVPAFNGTGSETNILDSTAEPQRYYRLKIDLL